MLIGRIALSAGTLGLLALACGRSGGEAEPRGEALQGVVDSVRPREQQLADFRAGSVPPRGLGNAAATRDELVRRFVAAVERADTAALTGMMLTRVEFGWLYYPSNPYARPPYDLSPELFWYTLRTAGENGLARTLYDYGGRPLGYVGYTCPPEPSVEGENRIHAPCDIRYTAGGTDTVTARLFGPIIELDGGFKFVNLASSFD